MPSLVTDPGRIIDDWPNVYPVETSTSLKTPTWTAVPHLYCEQLITAVNAKDSARLSYQIGKAVKQPGTTTYADYQPLAIKGKFVRVQITNDPADLYWYGYVLDDAVIREAVNNVAGVNKLVGKTQLIQCVGLEYFLDRKPITSAVVKRTGFDPDFVEIERPLTFNGGPTAALDPTSHLRGNRSQAETVLGYVFTDSFDGAPLWTAKQIIQYLLLHHPIRNTANAHVPIAWSLDGTDADNFLAGYTPTIRSEGVTIFEILNKICSPQRGLVWWVEFDTNFAGSGETWGIIRIASSAVALVALPSGGTLAANTNQQTLDFDGENDVTGVTLQTVTKRDYDQVVIRGARMTSTCTVGMADNTIIGDWSLLTGPNDPGTEKKYKEAAKNDADYGGLSDDQKRKRNDAFRRNDAFHRVYAAFRIPSAWDGKTGDGGTGQRNYALPILSQSGSIQGGLPMHVAGLRMLNTLRLKRGWDYSQPNNPKSATPSGTLPELQKPFVIVRVASLPDRYQYVDKLRQSDFAIGTPVSGKISTTYYPLMQQGVPGFLLQAHGGMPHALAGTAAWAGAEPSDTSPEVDYATLRATVCLEADGFCEAKYPLDVDLPPNKPLEILTIELGNQYRLDFLAESTVVGLNNGQPVLAAQAAVLRDDRPYLRDAARMAYEWYRVDRNALTASFRQIRGLFELGMLITTIGTGSTQQQVNTVLSKITYDFTAGTTTIETADETLDVRSQLA